MSTSLNHISGEGIVADRETLALLWLKLKINYDGTNISKSIAQLLQMYQPEDGIQSYERLLKTIFVLLEDFDKDYLKLLLFLIPPPKGCSDNIIQDIFFKTTGFIFNSVGEIQLKLSKKYINSFIKDNLSINTNTKNVSTSEISQDYSSIDLAYSQINMPSTLKNENVQSEKLAKSPISNNWVQPPYYLQNGNFMQLNPFYQDFMIKTPHCNPTKIHYFPYSYQQVSMKKMETQLKNNLDNNKNLPSQHEYDLYNSLKLKRSIDNDEVINSGYYTDLLENNYDISSNRVIKEMKNMKEIEESQEDNNNNLKIYEKILYNDIHKMDVVNCESNNSTFIEKYSPENLIIKRNLSNSIEKLINRFKKGVQLNQKNQIKSPDNSIKINRFNKIPMKMKRFHKASPRNKNYFQDEDVNPIVYQQHTMAELETYKRQYHDALLNVQRAKMALTNSLTLSSIQNYADYEACYPNHMQHWMFQQPQQFMMSQYGQRYVPSEFKNNPTNPWYRSSDWSPSSLSSLDAPVVHFPHNFDSQRFPGY